jgi:hypothetical protein
VDTRGLLTCATAFLLLEACTSPAPERIGEATSTTASPSGEATATPDRESLPRVARKLGSSPTDCTGPAPNPQQVVRHYGDLDGEEPIWGGIYARYRPEDQAYYASDARRTKYGFRVKVLWIIHPRHETPVTIEGRDVDNDEPIHFDVGASGNPVLSAHLDPKDPGTVPETNWREYPAYVFFSRASCYELEASWHGGSWRRVFGFGRR